MVTQGFREADEWLLMDGLAIGATLGARALCYKIIRISFFTEKEKN